MLIAQSGRSYSNIFFFCFKMNFYQNLYWADSGDLVAISSDASFYILKYNVRIIIYLPANFNLYQILSPLLFYLFFLRKYDKSTLFQNLQRDVVYAHLESGNSADEQGVEDAFELLYEINERVRTGIWVGDCFIYNNSSWRLNYCVGGEVGHKISLKYYRY